MCKHFLKFELKINDTDKYLLKKRSIPLNIAMQIKCTTTISQVWCGMDNVLCPHVSAW